jgi:hypothetical protein
VTPTEWVKGTVVGVTSINVAAVHVTGIAWLEPPVAEAVIAAVPCDRHRTTASAPPAPLLAAPLTVATLAFDVWYDTSAIIPSLCKATA